MLQRGYWEGAPDLAVEVISPNDTDTEVAEKVEEWLTAGCAMVWVYPSRVKETVAGTPRLLRMWSLWERTTSWKVATLLKGSDVRFQQIFI